MEGLKSVSEPIGAWGRDSLPREEPEWQQSKMAVSLHPAGRALTMMSCICYNKDMSDEHARRDRVRTSSTM